MDSSERANAETTSAIRTVVAATDFSETAAAALDWAVEVARPHGARVVLVHVLALPAPPTDLISPRPDLERHLEDAARTKLDEAAVALRERGVEVGPRLVPGQPARAVVETAEELGAGLIVVGTRGLGGLRHLVLGSTSQRVVQHARCPVLTVHPEDLGRHRPLRTVLLPTDFSEDARLAAEAARRLVGFPQPGARVVLLHAYNMPIEYTAYGPIPTSLHYLQDVGAAAEARLEEVAAGLREQGIEVETMSREGYPAEVIVEEAERLGADLIAMGTHGRSGLGHLLLGSTAERVVPRAPCPVLTLRRAG
jgi:nucleotide-binding universal stress UspA family protein